MSDIMLPSTERREIPLTIQARTAILEATHAANIAKVAMDNLLAGIVTSAGISQATIVEMKDGSLILDVVLHSNGNGNGHAD